MSDTWEPGAEGLPQAVIPGAERAPLRAVLERRMEAPKRARVAQRAAGSDGGLFDTGEGRQGSLL